MESVDQGVSRLGADLLVVPLEYTHLLRSADTDNTMAIVAVLPSTYRFDGTMLGDIGKVQGVAGVSPQLFVAAVSVPELSASPIDVYGIDPGRTSPSGPGCGTRCPTRSARGRWWSATSCGGRWGPSSRSRAGPTPSRAILDPTQSGIDRSVFVSLQDARVLASLDGTVPPGEPPIATGDVNAALVRVAPGEDPETIAFGITRLGADGKVTVIARHFSLDPVSENLRGLPGFLNTVSAVVLIAAFPLIALIAAMVANERRREIGLLRAMGARRSIVLLLVMAESLVLASLGAVAGIGASLVLLSVLESNGILNSALQVSFRIPSATEVSVYAGTAFLVVIAMAGISSLYPAYRAGRMNPLDAIREEGG